ncbi:MAG: DUF2461 domain-containing protein [Chitinophagaceae bacterium]|jgi:uncharacterized protein (TIGR02453 family)|nr:DUF2461 domain-containing protein [Chitinophagaceae bacterium]
MIQPKTLQFLKKLANHNNKSWFDEHRQEYEDARGDMEKFIQVLIDKHSLKDADITGLSAKKCLFRINRDVRFSNNKQPYKTNFGASMDRGGKKSGFAGYYFHLEPGKSFVGGGVWMPEPAIIKNIRQEIDYCLEEFESIILHNKFKQVYGGLYNEEAGIKLVNVPRGFEKDNPAAEYLKFKSWLAICNLSDEEITSNDLLKKSLHAFDVLQPLVKFLNRAIAHNE